MTPKLDPLATPDNEYVIIAGDLENVVQYCCGLNCVPLKRCVEDLTLGTCKHHLIESFQM